MGTRPGPSRPPRALGAAAADYARADQEVETQVGALAGGLGTVAPGIGWGADSPYRQQGPSSQTSEEIYQRLAKRLRGDQPAEPDVEGLR